MNMVFALKCSSALSSWYLDDAGSSIQTGVADTYVAYKIGIRKVGPCTMMAVARLCRKWLEELRWKLGQARVVSPGFGTEKSRIYHPNTGISMTAIHYCYLLAGHWKQQFVLFWKLCQKSDFPSRTMIWMAFLFSGHRDLRPESFRQWPVFGEVVLLLCMESMVWKISMSKFFQFMFFWLGKIFHINRRDMNYIPPKLRFIEMWHTIVVVSVCLSCCNLAVGKKCIMPPCLMTTWWGPSILSDLR